jgi:hypothetical protein
VRVIFFGIEEAFGRVGEPAVVGAAGEAGVAGLVPRQGDRDRVLRQHVGQVGQHQGGAVVEPVEDPQQGGADVLAVVEAGGGVVADEAEEVVAFVQGQAQRAGQGGGDLHGGLRAALLFEPGVVVGGHVGQRGDLFAA